LPSFENFDKLLDVVFVVDIVLVDQMHYEVDVVLKGNDVRSLHVLQHTVHDVEVGYLLSICVLLRGLKTNVKSSSITFLINSTIICASSGAAAACQ
jgi:hypothetical protein